jgi:hypothetical protein
MKQIKEMNLEECIGALRLETLPIDENWSFATFSHQDRIDIADRIEELTKPSPIKTVFPTFKDEWGNSDWRDKGEMGG